MPSLLLVVFVLQLVIHLINTVGAKAINELLWTLYNELPTSTSTSFQKSSELRLEVLKLRKEMNATSSQDEFAKWAKLRRKYDKAVAEYDEQGISPYTELQLDHDDADSLSPLANTLKSTKATFDQRVTILRWLGTNGLRFFIQFWYARMAMFWIPREWVPGYVSWLLAFPRAPRGGVSVQIWGMACAAVVDMGSKAAVGAWVVYQQRNGTGVKVAMEGNRGGGKEGGKKEL
ncbi:MAG: hypothetical protein Q9220_004023 [cf. Caloplaca sp. 1 TL-2023]